MAWYHGWRLDHRALKMKINVLNSQQMKYCKKGKVKNMISDT